MLKDALKKWDVDPLLSYFIGDKESDVKAGNLCGIKTILIASEPKAFHQTFTAANLSEAAELISKDCDLERTILK